MVGDQDSAASEEIETEDVFAFFSLQGERFDAPGMPVESVREVENFRAAILEVARHRWLDANPGRVHVPSGFADAFDLRLVGIKEGSAQPQLLLHRRHERVDDELWSEFEPAYTAARDDVTDAITSVRSQGDLPPAFPRQASKALRKIGQTLDDGESITVGPPDPSARRAVIDHEVRSLIERIDEDLPTTAVTVELEGVITEYDGQSRSFRLRTNHGVSTCRLEQFNAELADLARGYLALDGVTAPDVLVEGQTMDADQRIVQLFNVHTITMVRSAGEKVLMHRLSDLAALEPGWLGPGSEAPSQELIDRAQQILPTIANMGVDVAILGQADGSIAFEWQRGEVEMSAAIEANGELFLCADNTVTDEVQELQVTYDEVLLLRFLLTGVMD